MSQPIWISEPLKIAFEHTVVQAMCSPHVYHPTYAPIPWLVALHGRPGMDKLQVVEMLCKAYGLSSSYTTVVVKIGETMASLNSIKCIAQATKDVGTQQGSTNPLHIIVIEHADVLCYEPDTETSLLQSITLGELCESTGVLVVGIFDRLPGDFQGQTSAWAKECHNKFYAQFDTTIYLDAPDASFRAELFKFYIEGFVTHYNKTHTDPITCDLKEEDYVTLADCSTFATPENILFFMRKVFLNVLHSNTQELTLTYIEGFTNTKYGAPHICQ